jgi:hypothetical protein
MPRDYSSISRLGLTEPFELQVSRGQISYHSTVFKFGSNTNVQNSLETIWDGSSLYPFGTTYATTAFQISVSSSDANDTSAGTGARKVVVIYLDANWAEQTVEITLSGQTPVTYTLDTAIRVYRAYVSEVGSGGTAAGDIYIYDNASATVTAGVPDEFYAKITLGENQTLMAVYTVPANHTLYLTRASVSSGTELGSAFITGKVVCRKQNEPFRTQSKATFNEGFIDFDWELPLKIAEKTDIEVRAICSKAQSNAVAASFQGILIRNVE